MVRTTFAVDAVRGSLLAVHAAASLTAPESRAAARLLRVAEGLTKAALDMLRSQVQPRPSEPVCTPQDAAEHGGKPTSGKRRNRPRGKKGAGRSPKEPAAQADIAMSSNGDTAKAAAASAACSAAAPIGNMACDEGGASAAKRQCIGTLPGLSQTMQLAPGQATGTVLAGMLRQLAQIAETGATPDGGWSLMLGEFAKTCKSSGFG
mmetsp:Transcript_42864/g.82059  ORF Transcript_42864/g.82059 Transcript_42864/m.82059 type:complete len:206 (+) Transcript_42864:88-705(+)